MGAGKNIQLLVTGDFDRDGKDEIAVTFSDSGTKLRVYDGGATAAAGAWTKWYEAAFGGTWKDMASGDFNNDTYDDLALVRNADRLIKVYKGGTSGLSDLAERGGYGTDWLAVAGGNVFSDFAGDEIALDRNGANAATDGLLIFRVVGNAFVDIGEGPAYRYNPNFTSMALGDLNGDGDDEILLLRDPVTDKVSLLMVNPAGAAMRAIELAIGFGSAAWKLVRTGDTDGDGRDEVVVERGDGYRVYTGLEANDSYAPGAGPLYTTSTFSNLPTMAVANVDGPGVSLGPELSVSPKTLTFDLEYRQPSPTQNLTIKNIGTSDVISWKAEVVEGGDWLRLGATSGSTEGVLGVSVELERGPAQRYPLRRQDSHHSHERRVGDGQPERCHGEPEGAGCGHGGRPQGSELRAPVWCSIPDSAGKHHQCGREQPDRLESIRAEGQRMAGIECDPGYQPQHAEYQRRHARRAARQLHGFRSGRDDGCPGCRRDPLHHS